MATAAMAMAEDTEAMAPDAYITADWKPDLDRSDGLLTARVGTRKSLEMCLRLGGRDLARVERRRRMPSNLIPSAEPTR